jgi:hypothetical protein
MDFMGVFFKPLVSAAAAFFINSLFELKFPAAHSWTLFFVKTVLFTAVYFVMNIFVLRQFDEYDVDLLRGYLPFLKKSQ